jgi:small subunit ribosomal protein S3
MEDTILREWLEKKLAQAHIKSIEIERSPNVVTIFIKTSRPGILIGRGGEGMEKLKLDIEKKIAKIWKRKVVEKRELKINVEEVKAAPETHAAIAAQMMVDELEKRIPFRRVMKQMIEKISSSKDVQGVKIALKGRLDGAEMARYEWLKKGRIPLQTMRADVDYSSKTAHTTYGTIGVKVWIYKGDVFENKKLKSQS